MKIGRKLLDGIDSLNEWSGKTFAFLSLLLTGVVVYDVFLRYFLSSPTIWGLEFSCILLAMITFLGGGYSFLHGGQVKVDFLYQRWFPRTRAMVDFFTYFFIFAFCFILVWQGGLVAWESIREGRESTSAWAPPLWPSQIMVPIGGFLVGLQALAKWVRNLAILRTGKDELASKLVSGEGGLFEKKKE
jgi:TRAP-type mannitol/chloroaromatic compound transport system permease small subunit